ncbi:cupin domain-containing protein [Serratia ficaria]|uniref:cupin domain-containing protein n=1 Tax=Serratia ficaria TaxID=61651 RepID=UPI00217AA407|nr:cupin domain-containing protein [Serratia ficaria]CAI1034400.1 Quercetin 2,3-dioxygenase [Serratia ficaria]CAI1223181.1 Quercetin 2,3-dioxygenase [Serratia ficaria]CAI2025241.1 Quercetin 2,3-dioxygenase [Serratia ficaria]CAI2429377.1 Quercetin 2,3-dioxygenase [Serratia ficaria]CAI2495172.1 Quercetin 2,3-dioxygenase [Serratia ficaria]
MTTNNVHRAADQLRYSFLQPGAGPKVWMSGDEYQILLDAKSSANTMTLIDALVPPGGGPPAHLHEDVDELFFVLDGQLEIMADGVTQIVTAGGRVFVRRNVPHAFLNRTDQTVRMLIFYTPAGVEQFFLAAGDPVTEGIAPPPATKDRTKREIEIASSHHITQAATEVRNSTDQNDKGSS